MDNHLLGKASSHMGLFMKWSILSPAILFNFCTGVSWSSRKCHLRSVSHGYWFCLCCTRNRIHAVLCGSKLHTLLLPSLQHKLALMREKPKNAALWSLGKIPDHTFNKEVFFYPELLIIYLQAFIYWLAPMHLPSSTLTLSALAQLQTAYASSPMHGRHCTAQFQEARIPTCVHNDVCKIAAGIF